MDMFAVQDLKGASILVAAMAVDYSDHASNLVAVVNA